MPASYPLDNPAASAEVRAELERLLDELTEREVELATAQAEVAEFSRRYAVLIGARMVLLDRLQAELAGRCAARRPADAAARLEADRLRAHAERSASEQRRFEEVERDEPAPQRPDASLKQLYRRVAQRIHPDRASDERDRVWRTQLMTEANRAYRAGDAASLREILTHADSGQVPGEIQPEPSSLDSRLERARSRLAEVMAELQRLYASRLFELMHAEKIARRQHRDLLREMADQLEAQINEAREKLG